MKNYIGAFVGVCVIAGLVWLYWGEGEEEDYTYTNPTWCEIKGNVSYDTGEKIYHLPEDEFYDETRIDRDYGERWFCTEKEAEEAGFRRSER